MTRDEILQLYGVDNEVELRRRFLFRICETKQELHDWVQAFLGIDYPDAIVDPQSNSSPMDMIFECYSKARYGKDEDFIRVLYYACRDGFKTLAASTIEVLAIIHLGIDVAHMAAISDQASKAQQYVKSAFRRPYLKDFVEGDNERVTKITRFYNRELNHSLTRAEYEALSADDKAKHQEIAHALPQYREKANYVKVVICTMAGANSEHVPLFVIDEVDVVPNPAAYAEAQNIPAGRRGRLPLTILTSTRKFAFSLVQKEIDNRAKSGLVVRHWNLIDVTRRCEPDRHKPELPRVKLYYSLEDLRHVDEAGYEAMNFKERESYVEGEGFAGCAKCPLFSVCQTRLATHQTSTSPLLKPIAETIAKFKANSIEMAKAQLLCWKPAGTGLIYARFDRTRHVLSPAQAYAKVWGELPPDPKNFTKAMLMEAFQTREIEHRAGLDWGSTHNFAYVHGVRDHNRMFITHCVSLPELDPEQMLSVVEPFRRFDPTIYPDMADPKMNKLFKKHGFRTQKWNKGPGTVHGGIQIVRFKLMPAVGEPELFFVHDIDEDPGMDLLIEHLAEYHWTVDAAGRATDVPDKTKDDEPDALRYLVMNTFEPKGRLISASGGQAETVEVHPSAGIEHGYDPQNWVRQLIAEKTGAPYTSPERPERKMTIEAPANSGFQSYYGDNGAEEQQRGKKKGKRGGLIWDLT